MGLIAVEMGNPSLKAVKNEEVLRGGVVIGNVANRIASGLVIGS